ncbi:MAG TPA: chemotaxis protein CheW [Vicinamibacterales bacterium]|jgi:purine-binding chemotaxis protein CheW
MTDIDQTRAAGGVAEAGDRQFATFFVDNLLFGVEVLRVQEVLRYQEMTPVPRAPEQIEGLINLRGQIVTAIDVRRRLGLGARESGRTPMNMVIRAEDGAVSLLVDEIGDVLDVEQSDFEPVPENVAPSIRDLTTGVYKMKERLLLVLDTNKAIETGYPAGRQRVQ